MVVIHRLCGYATEDVVRDVVDTGVSCGFEPSPLCHRRRKPVEEEPIPRAPRKQFPRAARIRRAYGRKDGSAIAL
jgi:hypothetical protein